MSVIRAPRPANNFYMLDKRISEDKRLGWAARGLLIYLLGKPDNWKVSIPALIQETSGAGFKTGRDGVYRILQELKDAGYARHVQTQGADGKIAGCDWKIGEVPQPLPENPTPHRDLPDTGLPHRENPDALLSTERLPRTERHQDIPSGFVELPFNPPAWGSNEPEVAATKVTTDDLIATWNLHCSGVRKITRCPPARRNLIQRAFKSEFDSDPAKWERFCKRVARAPFLAGENERGWRLPSIDWILRPQKIENLFADVYGGQAPASKPTYNPNLVPGDPGWRPAPGTI